MALKTQDFKILGNFVKKTNKGRVENFAYFFHNIWLRERESLKIFPTAFFAYVEIGEIPT